MPMEKTKAAAGLILLCAALIALTQIFNLPIGKKSLYGAAGRSGVIANVCALTMPDKGCTAYRNFLAEDLEDFLPKNPIILDGLEKRTRVFAVNELRDAYLTETDNDGAPELILVFQAAEHGECAYAVIKNTPDGMRLSENIKLYASGGGTMGRWYAQLLRGKDGAVYNYEYRYFSTVNDGRISQYTHTLRRYNGSLTAQAEKRVSFFTRRGSSEGDCCEINDRAVSEEEFKRVSEEQSREIEAYETAFDPTAFYGYDGGKKAEFAEGRDFLKLMPITD